MSELHTLEIEVEEIKKASGAETLGGIIDAISGRPDSLYLLIAACSRLGQEASHYNEYFKKNRDITVIEQQITRFGYHPRMAPLFIPENLPAVIAYRNLFFPTQAKALVNSLLLNDKQKYLEEIELMRDSIFDGNISLAIKQFNPRLNEDEPEEAIEEHIRLEETFAAGSSDESNYLNFHFYQLQQCSFVDKSKLDEPLDKIMFKLKDKLTLDLYLTGYITKSGVRFQVNLTPSLSIFEDLSPNPWKFNSMQEISHGVAKDFAEDQIGQQITDLVLSQPSASSMAAGAIAAAVTVGKNLVKFDDNSRKAQIEAYVNEIRSSKESFEEYYSEFAKSHLLATMRKHDLELSNEEEDLKWICANIFKKKMQWINAYVREHRDGFEEFKLKYPYRDLDSIKLFYACELMVKPEIENHHKSKKKKQIL